MTFVQTTLGVIHDSGSGCAAPGEGVEWCLETGAEGEDDLFTLNDLGVVYMEGRWVPRDPLTAFQLFLRAARQGYAPACFNLGLIYAGGQPGSTDCIRAWAWLDLAAGSIPDAAAVRDALSRCMTAAEIAEARAFAASVCRHSASARNCAL